MEVAGVSEGMRALLDAHKKVHESVLRLQAQIEEEEAAYLEETPHGNIIRGWDGFIDAKQPRKDAATKKTKPYSDAEHLFSGCCAYAALATEPSIDLVDPTAAAADEAAATGRRKLSSSISGATATAAVGGASAGGSKLQRASSLSERKASVGSASGKGATAASAAFGKASKLKKRRREQQLESQESVELLEAASPAQETGTGGADKDFLDVF